MRDSSTPENWRVPRSATEAVRDPLVRWTRAGGRLSIVAMIPESTTDYFRDGAYEDATFYGNTNVMAILNSIKKCLSQKHRSQINDII